MQRREARERAAERVKECSGEPGESSVDEATREEIEQEAVVNGIK